MQGSGRLPLPREWFALQLRFAERAAAVLGLDFAAALWTCTNFVRACGLSEHDDPTDPRWQGFVRGLRVADDQAGWACDFVRQARREALHADGCFSYDYESETRQIGLHFLNNDPSPLGALSRERLPERRRELRALFATIGRAHPAAATVHGTSWLYGIEAYRRLFPLAYWRTIIPVDTESEYQYMALWGQFLARDGQVKSSLVQPFLASVEAARTPDELAAAFPHRVYEVECAIDHFFAFYEIERGRDD